MHPLTLRFPGSLEDAFREDYFRKSLSQIRFSLMLGIVLFALFGALDALLIPEVKEAVWFIRFAIVCPFFILLLLFTRSRFFQKYMQPILATAILVTGLSIVSMTLIAYPPGSYYYYAGLILVLMWAYTFFATRFIYASLACWAVVVAYEIVAIGLTNTPIQVLISNNFFFLSANIIGMLACYTTELYKRRDFWQRRLLEEEQARSEALLGELHQELLLASEIQKSLLPPPNLERPGIEITCYSRSTIEIGGDFYAYHLFDDGRIALAMGDASGHGIPAALVMAASLSLFGATFSAEINPCDRLSQLDRELVPYTEPRHQNCAFCYVELDQHLLYTANAGGIPPFIRRVNGGGVEKLRVDGFPLGHGLGAELGYQGVQAELNAGDMVVLVSDGMVEAQNTGEEMFGFERLKQAIERGPGGRAPAMLNHLISEVEGFVGQTPLQDDFTIAVLRLTA
jgi:serine phosphatase RsbU (regulator of sigma subunit)